MLDSENRKRQSSSIASHRRSASLVYAAMILAFVSTVRAGKFESTDNFRFWNKFAWYSDATTATR
jgi:hypothetical protein